jgi:hypothetical protein
MTKSRIVKKDGRAMRLEMVFIRFFSDMALDDG